MVQISRMIKYLGAFWIMVYPSNIISPPNAEQHCGTDNSWNPSDQACMTLVLGLVMSNLDYVNSAFIGLPASDINKMQRVQNAAAKFVLNLKRMDSSIEALKKLHWLTIRFRIQFKILLLVYECLNGLAPSNLMELLELKSTMSRLGLRSTCDRTLLCIPFT